MEQSRALYILLARLTDEGQKMLHEDRERVNAVTSIVHVPGAALLARYAVLGQYDFVMMVEAQDHSSVARLSLELGARLGLHIETLPAIPLGLFADKKDEEATPVSTREPEPTGL
ncbi:MAG: GYD domain-containing protein [Chloroflexi bacterium]|nr:GYD domain-containing protein [Chloroflexota bacterium]